MLFTTRLALVVTCICLSYVSISTTLAETPSKPRQNHRADVILFGQPCQLEGPFETKILKQIHSISPEKMSQIFTVKQAQDALSILGKAAQMPDKLKFYREQTAKRIEALLAYYREAQSFKKNKSADVFLKALSAYLPGKNNDRFSLVAAKWFKNPNDHDAYDQMTESYKTSIVPDPESEFHRAIRQLNIEYNCYLEEANDEEGE